MSCWNAEVETIAGGARGRLSRMLRGGPGMIALSLEMEVYGRAQTQASWQVDSQSPEQAIATTVSSIRAALSYQPTPFSGNVRVIADGRTLYSRYVRVGP